MQVNFIPRPQPHTFQAQFTKGLRIPLRAASPEEALRMATRLDSTEARRVVQFAGEEIVTSWSLAALMVFYSTDRKHYTAQWRNADSGVTVGIVE